MAPIQPYTDGLKIYTTINSRMQSFGEEAMRTHISSLQKDFYKHWKGYSKAPFPKDFEQEQIDMIMEQAMKRSKDIENSKRLESQKRD